MFFRKLIVLPALIFLVACESGDGPNPDRDQALREIRKVSTAFKDNANDFAFELFQKVFHEEEEAENIMISPLSVHIALGMLANGADGNTRQQLVEALRLEGFTEAEANAFYRALLDALPNLDPKVKMDIANSVWYDDQFAASPAFLETVSRAFSAMVQRVPFSNPATVQKINQWVSQSTRGKIEKIVDQITPEQVMFLINAVYFKGDWKHQFPKNNTQKADFFLESGGTKQVDMMSMRSSLAYFQSQDMDAVVLPYGDGKFQMTIILPTQKSDLATLVQNFEESLWQQIQTNAQPANLTLFLPKFTTKYEVTLNQSLQAMGIQDAFADGIANLSRIADARLSVSEVKHKTFIQLDEEGTEAAAVTSIGIEVTSIGPSGPTMRCDRPFLYVISETALGTVIFQGVYRG
jgi:serpin B